MHVTWTLPDGTQKAAEVADGVNLMEAAVSHDIPNVVGACGGCLSCATCHVFVATDWLDRIGDMGDFEDAMLDTTEAERQENSRLSCQIIASAALDGLQLIVPDPE